MIASACLQRINQFTIFNRWGEVIYHRENLLPWEPSAGWDGTYRGKAADVGVYTYQVTVELTEGSERQQKGSVTLVR